MNDPKRWRDGGDATSRSAEAFARGLRPTGGISAQQREASRVAIGNAILTAAPSAIGAWTSSLGAKVVFGLFVVGAGASIVRWAHPRSAHSAHVIHVHTALPDDARHVERGPVPSALPATAATPSESPVASPPVVTILTAPRTHALHRVASNSLPSDANESSGDSLAREARVLELARAALENNPAAALQLLRSSANEFRNGELGAEREYLFIEALRRTGRTGDARARAERFLAQFPSSPYAGPVRRISAMLR